MKRQPKVAVVGGGIMGASAAWHLAHVGADVTLIAKTSDTRTDATTHSFGWVGTGASLPSNNLSAFAFHLQAIDEFARMQRELGPLPVAVRGALIWWETEDATAAFLSEQRSAGVRMEAVYQKDIASREPGLALRPPLAAWAPDDFALEPAQFVSQLIEAAIAQGTRPHRGTAENIETIAGRVTGVRVSGEVIPADIVVLANGYGAHSLGRSVGIDLPFLESPAVLIRFESAAGAVRHLLCGSGLEVRPTSGSGLCSAADFPVEGPEGLPALALQTASSIAQLLGLPTRPRVLSVTAAQRPMTIGGKPFRGFIPGVEGLYALVAHPGVTYAPLLGRLAAADIANA